MPHTPFVSVIIPSRGRPKRLEQTLQHLETTLAAYQHAEVIVAYDGENEGPSSPASTWPKNIPLSFLRLEHRGPAATRNHALKEAKGDLLLFLNDDVDAAPDLIEKHVEIQKQSRTPLSVLGRFVFTEALRQDPFCRLLEDTGVTHTKQLGERLCLTSYRSFWTANLSVPRAAVEAVGGFDPLFTEPSCEDVDLGYRLEKELGIELFYAPNAVTFHDHHHTPEMWKRRNRMNGRNALRLYIKHGIGCDPGALIDNRRFVPERVSAFREALRKEENEVNRKRDMLEHLLAQEKACDNEREPTEDASRWILPDTATTTRCDNEREPTEDASKTERFQQMTVLLQDIERHDSLSGFADALWARLPREGNRRIRIALG